MPSYDYKCKTCDNSVTLVTGIKEQHEIPSCAKCKADMVREYGLGTITFKGSGFYRTDK